MLKLINIKKDYLVNDEKIEVLKGINVEFRKNEFVAILGPSGCGKTTLLNIIGGLDRYDEGDMFIDGISTKKYKDLDWDAYRNHRIGFVFQSYNLIPHLNVLENVEIALTISGMSKQERRHKSIEALEKVGLKDKIEKQPNQLSGGEMQRVAIARAIVNDPDIILADEPTGALDSKTSVQIMNILKEIGKDKLIVMVTHNPQLADEYANRKIELLDGKIISDSNPLKEESVSSNSENFMNKTAMSFFAALTLSLKNLLTKKTRTIFTFIAGSVGIIGVALVLSMSNGMNRYIDKMQSDTLASYPLTIQEKTADVEGIISEIANMESDLDKYPDVKEAYISEIIDVYNNIKTKNNITEEYVENVIKKIEPSLLNGVSYTRKVEFNVFTNNGMMKQTSNGENLYVKLTTKNIWQEVLDNDEFINSQYDVLEGRLPKNADEIVLVVDKYNQLMDASLLSIGLYQDGQKKKSYTFNELMNLEFKVLTNDEMYYFENEKYHFNGVEINENRLVVEEAYNKGLTLKVVGIIRPNQNTNVGLIFGNIGYTSKLVDYIIEKDQKSSIANYLKNNVNINPFSGEEYVVNSSDNTIEEMYRNDLKKYGVDNTPSKISIYPKDFASKEKIKDYLDSYNKNKGENEKIRYLDLMEIVIKVIKTIVESVAFILIAFSSTALIVSSIMIAITTYVSVIERTKEIGVLRSIGARKKDISRVFNAETLIIGFISGVIGVCVALLLNIGINMIVVRNIEGMDKIASLNPWHGIILIVISVILTLLSGFIPSKIASNKDPVVALRSE